MKEKTVCFSGHRPEKLPFNGDITYPEVKCLMSKLYLEIDKSIKQGYTTFISGVAKGVDIWAAKYILEQKDTNPEIKLICAIPYEGYGSGWIGVDKWDLNWIIYKADEIHYICDKYYPYCMKKRNEFMVENSSKLIAVVENYNSGTGQTIRLAQKKNLDIKLLDVKRKVQL